MQVLEALGVNPHMIPKFLKMACVFSLLSFPALAEDIANQILESYSAITSYEDKGKAIVEMRSNDGFHSLTEINFETKYLINGNLYFNWNETVKHLGGADLSVVDRIKNYFGRLTEKKEYAFWREGTEVYSEYPRGKEKEDDICSAYAGATGISNGLASNVPRYLVSEECSDYAYKVFPGARNLGITKKGLLIELTYHTGTTEKLYVSPSTLLLQETESEKILKDGTHVKYSVLYNIQHVEFTPNKAKHSDSQ